MEKLTFTVSEALSPNPAYSTGLATITVTVDDNTDNRLNISADIPIERFAQDKLTEQDVHNMAEAMKDAVLVFFSKKKD